MTSVAHPEARPATEDDSNLGRGDAAPADAPSRLRRIVTRWGSAAGAFVLGALALWSLHRALSAVPLPAVTAIAAAIPRFRIWLALLLTVLCYAVLLGYDALALRYVRRRLKLHRTALASFIAYAFSQNLGFSVLAGASVRYRFWSGWGLSSGEIAQGIAFTSISFWLGVLGVGGVALLLNSTPLIVSPIGAIPRAFGAILLAPVAVYLAWAARARRPLIVRGWSFPPPRPWLAVAQVVVSTIDWTVAGLVLFVLLPTVPGLTLFGVLTAFLAAQLAGLASHVPGGLSVFEWCMVTLLQPYLPAETTLASLLAYRVIYYLIPLGVATVSFATYEMMARRGKAVRMFRSAGRLAAAAAPLWLSTVTFVSGGILLVSGSTPSMHSRMRWLDAFLPLGVMELSHFVASLVGFALLLLANGIRRRLDAAFHLTVAMLVVGMLASLLKGFDWEEVLALGVVLAALLPARRHFYRRAALLAEPFTPGWIAAIALALAGTFWLGLVSYRHLDYSTSLWWRFAATADAPRFLRATVGIALMGICFAAARLLRPAPAAHAFPTPSDLDRAKIIAGSARVSAANLALSGDKSLLFSDSGRSFIQYGVMKRSWVALGDPVGDPAEFPELAWRFKEAADRHGAWPVFYQAGREYLPMYIDLGLTLLKLGEEARVPLATFSLDGGRWKPQRRIIRDAEKAGARVEVIAPDDVRAHVDELRAVSDAWLAQKHTREKGFSLGFFSPEYLEHFPVAVVRVDGRIVAFANIWTSGGMEELSVDLMRFTPDAPRSVMEYLFLELMLWGKAQGYASFNLGMAPLSGFEVRALAPVWSRIGGLVFRQGEHFYNFRGLRQYKEKFDPHWEPRYLASPAGLALPRILAHVASLISGGLRGVVSK